MDKKILRNSIIAIVVIIVAIVFTPMIVGNTNKKDVRAKKNNEKIEVKNTENKLGIKDFEGTWKVTSNIELDPDEACIGLNNANFNIFNTNMIGSIVNIDGGSFTINYKQNKTIKSPAYAKPIEFQNVDIKTPKYTVIQANDKNFNFGNGLKLADINVNNNVAELSVSGDQGIKFWKKDSNHLVMEKVGIFYNLVKTEKKTPNVNVEKNEKPKTQEVQNNASQTTAKVKVAESQKVEPIKPKAAEPVEAAKPLNKNQVFSQISALNNETQNYFKSEGSIESQTENSVDYYNRWNNQLNLIYNNLMATLKGSERSKLENDELNWLSKKNQILNSIKMKYAKQKDQELQVNKEAIRLTATRTYGLVRGYMN